jgi:hypothetical protein
VAAVSEQIKVLPTLSGHLHSCFPGAGAFSRNRMALPPGKGSPTRSPAPRYVGDVGDSAVETSQSKGGCSVPRAPARLARLDSRPGSEGGSR